jgi:hypothetical protein
VADTFLVVWRRIESVPDGDAERLWLYRVAHRVLGKIGAVRGVVAHMTRRPPTVAVTAVPATTTPSDAAMTIAPAPASAPTPTTEPTPTTAAASTAPTDWSSVEVPLVQSGDAVATPVGEITWTRVEGDATSLPQSVDFEDDGWFYGSDDDGTSWRSDDEITWTDSLPGRRSGDRKVGDDVWTVIESATPEELPQLARWDDTMFVPHELPELVEPEVNGLRPTTRWLRSTPFRSEMLVVTSTSYGPRPEQRHHVLRRRDQLRDDGRIRMGRRRHGEVPHHVRGQRGPVRTRPRPGRRPGRPGRPADPLAGGNGRRRGRVA